MSNIYEETGTVKLTNGTATFRYTLRDPNTEIANNVDCVVENPVNLSNRVNIVPGYVPPVDTSETFTVNTSMVGDEIVYDFTSSKINSTTTAPFTLIESSVDAVVVPSETYTVTGVKSGNNVVFTVQSSLATSASTIKLTMDEITGASTVLKTQSVNLTLVAGKTTSTFALSQPNPSVQNKVVGTLDDVAKTNTSVIVPQYVPPVVPPVVNPRYVLTTSTSLSNVTTKTGSGTGTVTFSGNLNDSSDNSARTITLSGNMHGDSTPHVGSVTCSPASFSMTRGESRTYTFTWSLSDSSIKSGRIVSTASMDAFNAYTNGTSINVKFKV